MTLTELIERTRSEADSGEPLDLLACAAERQQELSELGDQLLDHFVQEARSAGCSWSQIGNTLGVTKQAAQQRHSGERGLFDKLKSTVSGPLGGLFTRFRPSARAAVVLAQEEARRLNHEQIGPEHILIGVAAQTESLGARALLAAGADADRLRAAVEQVDGRRSRRLSRHLRFAPQTKKLLEIALREAFRLEHSYLDTEHIVLAVVTEGTGPAVQVLQRCGITPDELRNTVHRLLDQQQ